MSRVSEGKCAHVAADVRRTDLKAMKAGWRMPSINSPGLEVKDCCAYTEQWLQDYLVTGHLVLHAER